MGITMMLMKRHEGEDGGEVGEDEKVVEDSEAICW